MKQNGTGKKQTVPASRDSNKKTPLGGNSKMNGMHSVQSSIQGLPPNQ